MTHERPELSSLLDEARSVRTIPRPEMARAIRLEAGVSQEAMAVAVGVSRQAVALWEAGLRRPSAVYRDAYVSALTALKEEIDGRPAA